jgi:hypothetical protein
VPTKVLVKSCRVPDLGSKDSVEQSQVVFTAHLSVEAAEHVNTILVKYEW